MRVWVIIAHVRPAPQFAHLAPRPILSHTIVCTPCSQGHLKLYHSLYIMLPGPFEAVPQFAHHAPRPILSCRCSQGHLRIHEWRQMDKDKVTGCAAFVNFFVLAYLYSSIFLSLCLSLFRDTTRVVGASLEAAWTITFTSHCL